MQSSQIPYAVAKLGGLATPCSHIGYLRALVIVVLFYAAITSSAWRHCPQVIPVRPLEYSNRLITSELGIQVVQDDPAILRIRKISGPFHVIGQITTRRVFSFIPRQHPLIKRHPYYLQNRPIRLIRRLFGTRKRTEQDFLTRAYAYIHIRPSFSLTTPISHKEFFVPPFSDSKPSYFMRHAEQRRNKSLCGCYGCSRI